MSEARHQLDVALAGVLRAQGGGNRSDANLINIRSPANGVVLRRFRESESVGAGWGASGGDR